MAETTDDHLATALEPLRRNPGGSAVLSDFDGVLVEISAYTKGQRLPEKTREYLKKIDAQYRLAAIITLRQAKWARSEVGFPIHVSGAGGPETLPANDDRVRVQPMYRLLGVYSRWWAMKEWDSHLRDAGVILEDKGPLMVFHFHGADDEAKARAAVDLTHERARKRRLLSHSNGPHAVGIGPSIRADKGEAVHRTLRHQPKIRCAVYLGDEITDVPAMKALEERVEKGQLDYALRIAVVGPHTPKAVIDAANLVVSGPAEAAQVLELLSQPIVS